MTAWLSAQRPEPLAGGLFYPELWGSSSTVSIFRFLALHTGKTRFLFTVEI